MPSSDVELTVFLPTLDEEESLKSLLPQIKREISALGVSHELLVVDGGSRDRTVEVARLAGARVVTQELPGYGGALLKGIAEARGERFLSMDADGSHPPALLPELWRKRDSADIVIASRYAPGGCADMSAWRYGLSRALNFVTRVLLDFPAADASGGYRLYRAAALKGLPVVTRDFSAQQEVLVRLAARGARVAEVPFRFAARVGGKSKASVLRFARSYLRLFWEILRVREGDDALAARGVVLLLGLAAGFWGLSWGLPAAERLRVLPEGRPLSRESAQRLSDAWAKLYAEIERSHERLDAEEPVTYLKGAAQFPPGWDFPPGALANSWRSFMLQTVQPDEKKAFIILSRMRPWRLEFEPLYAQYGGAFVYPLGAWLWFASKLGAATVTADMRHYLMNPAQMGRLYLLGRLFVLAFHLGGLWIIFSIGRRLSGWQTGAAASALWALLPAALLASHQVKPHAVALFWGLCSLHAALKAAESGRLRHFLICGAAAGLAAATSLLYLPFLALPALAWISRSDKKREFAFAAGLGVLLMILFNPYLVFSPQTFAWEFGVYGAQRHRLTLSGLGTWLLSSGIAAGMALALLCGAGVLAGLFRGGDRRRLAAVAVLLAGLVFVRFAEFNDAGSIRLYLLPLALGVVLAVDLLGAANKVICAVLLAACFGDTGVRGLAQLKAFGREASGTAARYQAADWLEANASAGDSIGLLRYPEPSSTPPIPFHRYRLVLADDPGVLVEEGPRWLVADEVRRTFMDSAARNGYDLAAQFPPARLLWAASADASAFADPGFFVWKKR